MKLNMNPTVDVDVIRSSRVQRRDASEKIERVMPPLGEIAR